MANFIDLTGSIFGRLVVKERAPNYEKYSKTHNRVLKYARWRCVCECGKECVVLATDLKSKSQISCGCLGRENTKVRLTTHGMKDTKEYLAWLAAKSRCFNKNSMKYSEYGGRGITMQEDWIDNFEKFYSYIGDSPSPNHSLDRIDNDGNYCEGNIRWATGVEQCHNQRRGRNHKNRFKYVKREKDKFLGLFSFNKKCYRTKRFESEMEAAIAVYKLYENIVGNYPKYIDEDLKTLGLI